MENKICSKCGAEMPNDAKFCTKCGQSFEKTTPRYQTNKQKLNKKSLYALLAVFAALFLIIFGAMFYSDYSERREARLAREKFVKDSLEVVRKDSLKLVAQKEKEMLEAKKLEEFRKKLTLSNILKLSKNPQNESLANKCGFSLLFNDSEQIEDEIEGEIVVYTVYNIAYGYETEKVNVGENSYEVKATSAHSCFFRYGRDSDEAWELNFVNHSDVDYFVNLLENNGFIKDKTIINSGESIYSFTKNNILFQLNDWLAGGWYKIYINNNE